jgi:hypothetical protein
MGRLDKEKFDPFILCDRQKCDQPAEYFRMGMA